MMSAGPTTLHTGCFAFLPRSYSGYSHLYASDSEEEQEPAATTATLAAVVVGKDRKVFMVDRSTLQQEPLQVLLAVAGATTTAAAGGRRKRSAKNSSSVDTIFVDVDEILFEHVLWLVKNGDCPAVLGMQLRDIIDFYANEDS